MKSIKRITIVILALALLCAALCVFATAAYDGTVAGLNELVTAIDSAEDKNAAVKAAEEYVAKVDPSEAGYADAVAALADKELALLADAVSTSLTETSFDGKYASLNGYYGLYELCNAGAKADGFAASLASAKTEAVAAAKLGLSGVDLESNGSALTKVLLNKIRRIVAIYALDDADVLSSLTAAEAAQAEKAEELKNAVEAELDFDEYEDVVDFNSTFSLGSSLPIHVNSGKAGRNTADREYGRDGENYYYNIRYIETETGGQITTLDTYASITLPDTTGGMVFELKLTTFSELPPEGIMFSSGEDNKLASGRVFPKIGVITSDGRIKGYDATEAYLNNASIIVPGQWISIAFVYDPLTYTVKTYVENEYVGTHSCALKNAEYKLTSIRIGNTATGGEVAVDDLYIYRGTDIRTINKFSSMTDEEKFVYFMNFALSEDFAPLSRAKAHERVGNMVDKFWDAEKQSYLTEDATVRAAVDSYNTFDSTPLYDAVKRNNLDTYKAMVSVLAEIPRSLETIAQRQGEINKIDTYAALNANFILINEEYNAALQTVLDAKTAVEWDTNITTFIEAMDKFVKASTSANKTRHYGAATEALELGVDMSVIDDPAYDSFKVAYENYLNAEQLIAETLKAENSQRIVDCVNYLKNFGTDLAVWEENADEMDTYVLIVREIVRAGTYDAEQESVADALTVFKVIDAYFYERLQQKHVAELNGKLAAYEAAPSYIDKLGLLSYIGRYLASSDIDYEDEQIKAAVAKYEQYNEEIKSDEALYDDYLEENSRKFVAAVTRMQATDSYAEKKAAYNEALICYYEMNLGSEGVEEALVIFDAADGEFARVEERSAAFVQTVALLKIARPAEVFELLVEAITYKAEVDDEVEGVAAAIEDFEVAYDEYMSGIDGVNAEVDGAVCAAGAVRTVSSGNTEVGKVTAGMLADKD